MSKLKQIIIREDELIGEIINDINKIGELNDDVDILNNLKHINFYLQGIKRTSAKKTEIVSSVIGREELKKNFSVIRPKSK